MSEVVRHTKGNRNIILGLLSSFLFFLTYFVASQFDPFPTSYLTYQEDALIDAAMWATLECVSSTLTPLSMYTSNSPNMQLASLCTVPPLFSFISRGLEIWYIQLNMIQALSSTKQASREKWPFWIASVHAFFSESHPASKRGRACSAFGQYFSCRSDLVSCFLCLRCSARQRQ